MASTDRARKRRKTIHAISSTSRSDHSMPLVRWTDLHLGLIQEIFRHIPTLERVKKRRVCAGWKSILEDEGSALTSALVLRPKDLSVYRYFCLERPKTNSQSFLRKLITPCTKTLMIDFFFVPTSWLENGRLAVPDYSSDWLYKKIPSGSLILQYHPQIKQVLLYRLTSYLHEVVSESGGILRHLGFGHEIGAGRSVTLSAFYMKHEGAVHDDMFYAGRDSRGVLPKTMMRCKDGTDQAEFYRPLYDNVVTLLWPYPPEQLKWVNGSIELLKAVYETPLGQRHMDVDRGSPFLDVHDQRRIIWGIMEEYRFMDVVFTEAEREQVREGKVVIVKGRIVCRLLGRIVRFTFMARWARQIEHRTTFWARAYKKTFAAEWSGWKQPPPVPFDIISRDLNIRYNSR